MFRHGASGELPGSNTNKHKEIHHMFTTRRVIGLLALVLFGGLFAALVAYAPLGHADTGESDYLADLRSAGVPVYDVQETLSLGHEICVGIEDNGSLGVTSSVAAGLSSGLDTETVATVVYDAVHDLCPSQIPVLKAWVDSHHTGSDTNTV